MGLVVILCQKTQYLQLRMYSYDEYENRITLGLEKLESVVMRIKKPFLSQLTPEHMRHGGIGYDTSDTFSEVGTSDDDSCHIGASSKFSKYEKHESFVIIVDLSIGDDATFAY